MDQIKFEYIGKLSVDSEHLWSHGYTCIWLDENYEWRNEDPEDSFKKVLIGMDDDYSDADLKSFENHFTDRKYLSDEGIDEKTFVTYKEFCDTWVCMSDASQEIIKERLGVDVLWVNTHSIEEWYDV